MASTSYASNREFSDKLTAIDLELAEIADQIKALKAKQRRLMENKKRLEATLDSRDEGQDEERWEKGEFPWASQICEIRKTKFRMDSFRHLQVGAINAVLSGEDVIVIMSTGGGKSLVYQLPAIHLDGLTLVVSPLVSLMEDQVMSLDKQLGPGVAVKLSQSCSKEEVAKIQNDMLDAKSKLRLLYVTPEKLAKSKRFMAKLEKAHEAGRLKLIAIDEVHCCSQWGHDFRPDYKFLNVLRRQFKKVHKEGDVKIISPKIKVPLLGLTATATASVLEDVKDMLGISGAITFRATFNRPNLFYEVRQKPAEKDLVLKDLISLISQRFASQSGIIYCFSRKESEEVAESLRSSGIKARWYHADMEPSTRSKVHEKWISGEIQVVVATVAFGMGIDKPDVRFVIHHSVAKSMENYYQESGRAGRDGKKAVCILYFRIADLFRQSTMVCTEKTGIQNLYPMLAYALSLDKCRRSIIAESFLENWDESWCQNQCDNCATKRKLTSKDIRAQAEFLVEATRSAVAKKQKMTGLKVLEAWNKGRKGVDKLETERILANLILKEYLMEDFHFTPYSIISYVVPGQKAGLLQSKDHQILVTVESTAGASSNIKKKKIMPKIPEPKKPRLNEDIIDLE